MGAVFFISSLCIINIILWLVFLSKFKHLFSTDEIIANTRDEMNRMIEDVNRNTERDITLINDRIKELKAVIADADRHLAVAKAESEKKQFSHQYSEKIAEIVSEQPAKETSVQRAAAQYRKAAQTFDPGNESYEITHEIHYEDKQQNLFDEQPTQINVKQDGSSFAKVPVVGPNIKMTDAPIQPKKDFNEQVKELSEQGIGVEEIARRLNRLVTEVQFALDMGA